MCVAKETLIKLVSITLYFCIFIDLLSFLF